MLLIACVNVANLLLARRGTSKAKFGLLVALRCGGFRVARHCDGERVARAGGRRNRPGTRRVDDDCVATSCRAICSSCHFAILRRFLSLYVLSFLRFGFWLTGILFEWIPALKWIRGDLPRRKEGSRGTSAGHSRLRHALVASEVALALVVLCGAG